MTAAVLISAVSFGVGHLGDAGSVPVHTDSLAGPVLLHVALNVVPVA